MLSLQLALSGLPAAARQPVGLNSRSGSLSGSRLCSSGRRRGAARARATGQLKVQAFKLEKHAWWDEHTAPNVIHINGAKELVEQLKAAGDSLVVVDYYARWCVACRAMFPELVKLARQNPDIVVLCIEYDANKELCKALEVKNIPFFQLYRQSGKVAAFSCGVSKLFILKDAIKKFRPLPAL